MVPERTHFCKSRTPHADCISSRAHPGCSTCSLTVPVTVAGDNHWTDLWSALSLSVGFQQVAAASVRGRHSRGTDLSLQFDPDGSLDPNLGKAGVGPSIFPCSLFIPPGGGPSASPAACQHLPPARAPWGEKSLFPLLTWMCGWRQPWWRRRVSVRTWPVPGSGASSPSTCTMFWLSLERSVSPPWGRDPWTEQALYTARGIVACLLPSPFPRWFLSTRCVNSNPFLIYLPKYCTWLFAVFSEPNVSFFVFLLFNTWCNRSCKDVPLYR